MPSIDSTSPPPQDAAWLQGIAPEDLRRTVDVLYRVHRFISLITDLDTLLERIMEESKQVARAEACSIMLYDPQTEELYFRVALGERGDQQALVREVRLKLDEGVAGAAAADRRSVNVPDVANDPRFCNRVDAASRFETHSLLAVPLVDRDKLVGVLEVVNKVDGGPFTDMDLHVTEMFGAVVATAIANARLIEQNLRSERLAAIGQAVAGLAHYTKNLIAGMTSSADLIDQGLAQNNHEFLERSWPVFLRSTRRIANFVEDMLAFSKPRKPILESCNIEALLNEVTQTLWGVTARKQATLHVDARAVRRPVLVDPRGLFRCLLNLALNATEAVPPQGGNIVITAKTLEDGALLIDVADNGPGVPECDWNRIFDPFFSTKGARGTGLGLAVSQKIVLEHGGLLSVMRDPSGGALFRIVLPQQEER